VLKPLASEARREEIADLARRASADDGTAKEALVKATLPLVYSLLFRLVGRRGELDDLAQNVYARCFRSLSSFRGEAAFTTWLGGICVHVAQAHFEKRKTQVNAGEVGPELSLIEVRDEHSVDAESELIARDGLRLVATILQRLSPTLRIPFVLHVIEEYDIETVAAMCASSTAATYKNVERARAALAVVAEKDPYLRRFLDRGRGPS